MEKLTVQVQTLTDKTSEIEEALLEKTVTSNELSKTLNEIIETNDYLVSLQNNDTVMLYDETAKVCNKDSQQCIYALLENNMTTSKVTPVIETVLKLVNLKPNRLPCLSSVNNTNIQRLILSEKQVSDVHVLVQKHNTCLLSDETSKYGKK